MREVGLQPLRIPTGWLVSFNQFFELDPDPNILDQDKASMFFGQDLLQFHHPNYDRLVDVGWYPCGDLAQGEYKLVVYERDFRGKLLQKYFTRSRLELVAALERVLNQSV